MNISSLGSRALAPSTSVPQQLPVIVWVGFLLTLRWLSEGTCTWGLQLLVFWIVLVPACLASKISPYYLSHVWKGTGFPRLFLPLSLRTEPWDRRFWSVRIPTVPSSVIWKKNINKEPEGLNYVFFSFPDPRAPECLLCLAPRVPRVG